MFQRIHPLTLLVGAVVTFGWSMTWFVGGPIDGLPGVDLQVLLDSGLLSAQDEVARYLLKYYSWPFVAGLSIGAIAFSSARMLTRKTLETTAALINGNIQPANASVKESELSC